MNTEITTEQERVPTLQTLKQGDMVAVYSNRGAHLSRKQVERCTATRITVGGQQYTRKGHPFGRSSDNYYFPSEWIRPWNEAEHAAEMEERQAQRRLDRSRNTLVAFRWRAVTQEQANAVLAAMQAAGMLEEKP
jgi:hypothetical protein